MALMHRALFTWFFLVILLILVIIRLESKNAFSWFIVFIPMWFYDLVVLIYTTFFVINRCRKLLEGHRFRVIFFSPHGQGPSTSAIKQKLNYLLGTLLKVTFQILLCLKLDSVWDLPYYYVCIPLWCFLAAGFYHCLMELIEQCRPDPNPLLMKTEDQPQSSQLLQQQQQQSSYQSRFESRYGIGSGGAAGAGAGDGDRLMSRRTTDGSSSSRPITMMTAAGDYPVLDQNRSSHLHHRST